MAKVSVLKQLYKKETEIFDHLSFWKGQARQDRGIGAATAAKIWGQIQKYEKQHKKIISEIKKEEKQWADFMGRKIRAEQPPGTQLTLPLKNSTLPLKKSGNVVQFDPAIKGKTLPLKGKGGAIKKVIASGGAPLRHGKLYRPVTNPEFRKAKGRVKPGSLPANTTTIFEPGNRKSLGWIRKETGAGKGTYTVKLHGGKWPSEGIVKSVGTDVKVFNTKKKAEDFVRKVLKGEDFALGGGVQKFAEGSEVNKPNYRGVGGYGQQFPSNITQVEGSPPSTEQGIRGLIRRSWRAAMETPLHPNSPTTLGDAAPGMLQGARFIPTGVGDVAELTNLGINMRDPEYRAQLLQAADPDISKPWHERNITLDPSLPPGLRAPEFNLNRAQMEALGAALPIVPGITAWHGTSHLVKPGQGFKKSKVGTGTGYSAYLPGLYSSQARRTGERFRSAGAGRQSARSWLTSPYGYLHKVDVPDKDVASYISWDDPLSKQSESVKDSIRKLSEPGGPLEGMPDWVWDPAKSVKGQIKSPDDWVFRNTHWNPDKGFTGQNIIQAMENFYRTKSLATMRKKTYLVPDRKSYKESGIRPKKGGQRNKE